MLEPNEIIALRTTLRHAANHLDEVAEAITEDYHNGNKAHADVTSRLMPHLNEIENYVTTLRHALTVMVTGGLRDDGQGNWWVGDGDGPYDTLAAALAAREDDEGFVTQGLVNVEDEQTRDELGISLPDDPIVHASPEERVLDGMRSAHSDGQGDWLSLTIVAEYAGMQDGQAETVLAGLAGKGQVEREGDQGAIYRLAPAPGGVIVMGGPETEADLRRILDYLVNRGLTVPFTAAVDEQTRALWRTSQHDRMVINLADEIQDAADKLREAAGLPEIG